MKIVNEHGQLQPIPFTLGERGRGRSAEEVRVDNRRPPEDPTDVGYKVFKAGEREHCVLTAPSGQPGMLLRVNCRGTYTRDSRGGSRVIAGNAHPLVAGYGAFGDAGNIGGWTDTLYHVRGLALLTMVPTGGVHKGYYRQYLFLDGDKGELITRSMAEAVQDLVTDEYPLIGRVCQAHKDALPDELAAALVAAEQLEDAEPCTDVVPHYGWSSQDDLPDDIRIPPGHTGGLQRGPSGCLLPGALALVKVDVGPGGGKRYQYDHVEVEGLDVIYRPGRESRRQARETIVGLAAGAWCVSWDEYKDNQFTQHRIVRTKLSPEDT